MSDLEDIAEQGFGEFNILLLHWLGTGTKREMEDIGVKLFSLSYGRNEPTLVIEDDHKRLVQNVLHKEVRLIEPYKDDSYFIGQANRHMDRRGYFVDPDSEISYILEINKSESKNSEVILKRLKKGTDLQKGWEDKELLLVDPEYVDAEVKMKYGMQIRWGAEKQYGGVEDGKYNDEDVSWTADITSSKDAGDDRVLKQFYQVLKNSINSFKKEISDKVNRVQTV